ncbi:MAG: glycerophosphodiester phosphodiesterase family protein [Candidatus Omnitrophota bacterium]
MVKIIAHQGFSGRYPGNTEIAFQKALALNVDAVEFDVHLSADAALIICHDGDVDRTSDGSGKISQLTLPEIKNLDAGGWFGKEFEKQRFLTLQEALDVLGTKIRLNIHVKTYEFDREKITPLIVKELERRNLLRQVFIASGEETIKLVKKIQPKLEICNLSRKPENTYIKRSLSVGCYILQPENIQVNQSFVEEAHRHGMEVNPFYADDIAEMRRLIQCGVDGILTNYPDVLLRVRKAISS